MKSGYWQDLTVEDFDGLDIEATIAVLPVAAIEQHGPHLPLATDALINEGIVHESLGRLRGRDGVVFLPALNFGSSAEHSDFPGTLSVAPERLLGVWRDIAAGVARAGIRKIVILNSHGGQRSLVDQAALKLRIDHGMLAVRCNYFSFGAPEGLFDAREWAAGLHGGEVETSLMLHLHPELVRAEKITDFESLAAVLGERNRWLGAEKPIGIGWKAQDLNPAGVAGNAAQADARRGAAYLEHIAQSLTELLQEVAATPLDVLSG